MLAAATAALLTFVQAEGPFDGQNAAADDWRVALDCQGEVGAVVEQAADTVEDYEIDGYAGQGQRVQAHELTVSVAQKVGTGQGGDAQAVTAAKATAEALADRIALYERLNGGTYVRSARVVRLTAPTEIRPLLQGGGTGAPTHIVVAVRVRVITSRAWAPVEQAS